MAKFQPYIGPRPFDQTEADRNRFFGRDDEAGELLSCVIAHRAVLLYAQSGAGKTSLINAKLTPMLQSSGFDVLNPARVGDVLPQEITPGAISNIFAFNVLRKWNSATDPSTLASTTLTEFLEDHQSDVTDGEDPRPRVAILDQFEELFSSYQERAKDREDFFDQVGTALERDRLLRVVFAMREDHIAEMDPYLFLLPEQLRTRYRIERLSEEDALLAITGPLHGSNYSYAAGVAEEIVENLLTVPIETASGVKRVRGESVDPVQLQVACQNLWDNCQESWGESSGEKRVITRKDLEKFGDVDEALSDFYEKAIKQVVQPAPVTEGVAISQARAGPPVKEGVLRRWFEQNLITSAGTRGTVFRGSKETSGIPNAAVDELIKQHILRGELRGGSRWYELTHDRLIAPIKASNERWLVEHSGGAQTPKRLEGRAEAWLQNGRQKTDLIEDEGEIREAERWLDSPAAADVGFSSTLVAYVQASRGAKTEEQARITRRLKFLAVALGVAVILLIGAAIGIFMSLRSAQAREQEAVAARQKSDEQREIVNKQRLEAEKQNILKDIIKRQLEIQLIINQGSQTLAEQSAARAQARERVIRQGLASTSKQLEEVGTEYEQVLEVPPKDLMQQCAALQNVQKGYQQVRDNSVALGKDVSGTRILINQIAKRLKDLGCPE